VTVQVLPQKLLAEQAVASFNMDEKYEPPLRFKAHYEGPCGEGYEVTGVYVPFLILPCEECETRHKFKLKFVEHL
jgi:hypothetical protein